MHLIHLTYLIQMFAKSGVKCYELGLRNLVSELGSFEEPTK